MHKQHWLVHNFAFKQSGFSVWAVGWEMTEGTETNFFKREEGKFWKPFKQMKLFGLAVRKGCRLLFNVQKVDKL